MGLFATPSEGEFLRPFCKHAPCPSCATYSAASSAGWRKPQRAPSQDVVGDEGGLGRGAPHPKVVGLVHGSTLGAVGPGLCNAAWAQGSNSGVWLTLLSGAAGVLLSLLLLLRLGAGSLRWGLCPLCVSWFVTELPRRWLGEPRVLWWVSSDPRLA